jgi:hypothetical protein
MVETPDPLRALVAEVGRFYVRDRKLLRAQERMAGALASGEPKDRDVRAYLHEVRRYFAGFEREAVDHLKAVDARLRRVSQEQFNLTAERGVAARRVEATKKILEALSGIDR